MLQTEPVLVAVVTGEVGQQHLLDVLLVLGNTEILESGRNILVSDRWIRDLAGIELKPY